MSISIRILITLILFINYSCSIDENCKKYSSQNILYPIQIKKDTTIINLQKYFSKNIHIKDINIGKYFNTSINKDTTSLSIIRNSLCNPLSNINISTSIGKFDILLKNVCTSSTIEQFSYIQEIYTNNDNIILILNNNSNTLLAYINNTLLKKEIEYKNDKYIIHIPNSKYLPSLSHLRIYIYNTKDNISNELIVPIKDGKIVKKRKEIEHIPTAYSPFKNYYKNAQYFMLYRNAINTFLLYSKNFTELDNILQNSICKYGYFRYMNYNNIKYSYLPNYNFLYAIDDNNSKLLNQYKKPKSFRYNQHRVNQLNVFLMTIPGAPTYYIKPTNFRVNLKEYKTPFEKLEKLRKTSMPLILGDFTSLRKDNITYAYCRRYFNEFCLVIFNRSKYLKKRKIDLPTLFNNVTAKSHFDSRFNISKSYLIIELQPYSFEIITGSFHH